MNNLTATIARGAKGTAHGSSAASQALAIEGSMISLATRAGDMFLDIKLRCCIQVADECWQNVSKAISNTKQACHAHALQPISAAGNSNQPSHTSKQSAQKE